MGKKFILPWIPFCLLLLILHSIRVSSQADEFVFNGFSGAETQIALNGAAQIQKNGMLKLTDDHPRIMGHAFYQTPIEFKDPTNGKSHSFSTSFVFGIVPEYEKLGGHGFAFTVAKSKELNNARASEFLGLMNEHDIGNFSNHVFAVEFDTVRDIEFGDINDNHVGIDINSLKSNVSVDASCVNIDCSRKEELNLHSGNRVHAWIDYDGFKGKLDVTLSLNPSKPNASILSFPVDLTPIFMDYMYVGFSASTGLLASSHYISGWSFMINGQAKPLSLSLLPSISGPKRNRLALILATSFSALAFVFLAIGISFCIIKNIRMRDVVESWEKDIGPNRFSYQELKKATRGFRVTEIIGFGGSGKVYKGTLRNSKTQVAVKRINHESKQGLREFMTEIASIGRLRHKNLVLLQGWCRCRDDLLLVYDFMPNGSLDKYIYDEPNIVLTWEQRFNIIKGVASALVYLHEECEQTVIHRDIKAGNVLLDSEMNGRLGDFGLAKIYAHNASPPTTNVVGTLGYLAPELTKTGKPTTSSDMFAFGALLLEVVCGRRPIEAKAMPEELILVDWVWDKWKEGSILEVVDPRLNGEYDEIEVVVVIKLGLLCSNNAPRKRPSTRQVVRILEGEAPTPEVLGPNGGGRISPGSPYPSSLHYEKMSAGLSGCDLEAGSSSPVPLL